MIETDARFFGWLAAAWHSLTWPQAVVLVAVIMRPIWPRAEWSALYGWQFPAIVIRTKKES